MDEELKKDMEQITFIPGTINDKYKYIAKIPKNIWNKYREDKITKDFKNIQYGNPKFEHFYDIVGDWGHLNHGDVYRREMYRKRHGAIKNKKGELSYQIPFTPAFFSMNLLW